MSSSTKCGDCNLYIECDIRLNIKDVLEKEIIKTKAQIKEKVPQNIDFIIIAEASAIPTNCPYFIPKKATTKVNLTQRYINLLNLSN